MMKTEKWGITSALCMLLRLQLEYWKDGEWFVGRLPQVPGVFSQGATLEELEENVRDAYRTMFGRGLEQAGYALKRSGGRHNAYYCVSANTVRS